ncbi:hypothetical protein [Algoriphagus aquimarinus]|uniref:DUF1700 domain-containing protein n=1 Tax=Algoriphagus aquimarinus TaxID=237018 RepID=A0A5C7B148_9BACT|nr:hypothetical protein [Algoriphagus aquimarinus]TXE12295.1 hypothetical protein ESV85_09685 [Algoriphagus aquimarinus]
MKNLSKEDEYIKKFMSELGTDEPSEGFHKSILERLSPKKSVSVYRPVISSFAWKIIGGAIAVIVLSVLLFLPSAENALPLVDQLPQVAIPKIALSLPRFSIPIINLSSIVIQSLVVFTLLACVTVISSLKKWNIS